MQQIRCFSRDDYRLSYVLPAGCATNIPRTGSVGGYGAHAVARGVFVEVLLHLDADPVALHLAEREGPRWAYIHQVLTVVVDTIRYGRVRVTTHRVSSPPGRHPLVDRWAIVVNGQRLLDEDRTHPPSPRYTGFLVYRALRGW